MLRVTLLAGKDLRAADRTGKLSCRVLLLLTRFPGKSDPFAVFTLHGTKVFTSQTKKKTLDPVWSESFEVSVVCLCTVHH